MKIKFLLSVLLLFSAQGLLASTAKTLLVSDIDDTIKVSHVLNIFGKVVRSTDVTTPFRGMSDLYRFIQKDQNLTSEKIIYLSNAPEKIAGVPALKISHQTFLKVNQFPEGVLDLRPDIFEQNHKIKELRRLIDQTMPEVVILIGDNGEKDAEIYHQIQAEYASVGIQVVTFIHQLYSSRESAFLPDRLSEKGHSLYPEQFGFVTPIEIALKLTELDLITEDSLQKLIDRNIKDIVNESSIKWDGLRPITFPLFKNCEDFKWNLSRGQQLLPLIKKIEHECN